MYLVHASRPVEEESLLCLALLSNGLMSFPLRGFDSFLSQAMLSAYMPLQLVSLKFVYIKEALCVVFFCKCHGFVANAFRHQGLDLACSLVLSWRALDYSTSTKDHFMFQLNFNSNVENCGWL
ncbi:UNVERIFIED_CONTAM: hypothetical protein K2H54_055200 [Gekko kuhli]